ncbi:hypothetical protein C8R45DRAFT_345301 [Mycena sanguinolenta]|nr:hypothetical protein C8R45DRAFT_345301 [Mycena sanguinolenta]
MFAPSYKPSFPSHQYRRETPSPRDRYLYALSRVRQAEVEYAAYVEAQQRQNEQARAVHARQARLEYVMQQERARRIQAQQRHNEQAVKRMQMLVLHAAVSSLLIAQDIQRTQAEKQLTTNPHSGPQLRRNHIRFVRRPKTVDEPVPAVETALKRRLAVEPNVEVHATIQNILSNLSCNSADPPVVSKSTAAIQRVARRLRRLSSEFTFPSQLDFVSEASGGYTAAQLPYTPRNGPVRHYENALNDLLSQLDAIDSEGDTAVRRQRKLVVGMVEKTIQDLDRIIEGRWKLQDTRGNNTRPDATAPTVAASTSVANDDSTTFPRAALSTDLPSTPLTKDESQPAKEPLPVPSINGQEQVSQALVWSVGAEGQDESLQGESSLLLGSELATIPIRSDSQPMEVHPELPLTVNVPADQEHTTTLPVVPPSSPTPLSVTLDEESVAAVDPSPQSLSVVVPLPDEDLVVVENDDDSTSSWSELED